MGTGTRDIIALCRRAGLPEPEFAVRDGFVMTIRRVTRQVGGQVTGQDAPQVTTQVAPQVAEQYKLMRGRVLSELAAALALSTTQVTTQVATLLAAATDAASREDLQNAVGLQNRAHFRQTYIEPLVTHGWLEMTVPDKPTSRLQKYRLTPAGRAWLESTQSI